ncbi:hypothetical protein [Chromobacterium sphagni]|uniref:hypothetical protein n=1 Tax=Chromobacterium sphagni TaxID=1903179 RepID=UPI001113841C|nr:hypothetical protein [Chromobacterium sphagni]
MNSIWHFYGDGGEERRWMIFIAVNGIPNIFFWVRRGISNQVFVFICNPPVLAVLQCGGRLPTIKAGLELLNSRWAFFIAEIMAEESGWQWLWLDLH